MTDLCSIQEEKERKEQEEQRKKYDEDAKKKKALSNMTQQYSAGQKVIQLLMAFSTSMCNIMNRDGKVLYFSKSTNTTVQKYSVTSKSHACTLLLK